MWYNNINYMKKLFLFIAISLILILAASVWMIFFNEKPSELSNNRLQICPNAWIDNQEPGGVPDEGNQYYVLDGARREINEFDAEWVKTNCQLKKQVVF